jgi:hypothetical protein
MHDWYVSSTLVEAPTSLIGTCFMEDLAYMYDFVVLVHVHVLVHS